MRNTCEVSDCGKPIVAHGLCNMHRQRYARHGSVAAARPEGWGSKSKHPLHERWKSMRRIARGHVVPRWDDFWAFVEDVGAPPTPDARIYKREAAKPYGPDNIIWREPVSITGSGKTREARNAYMREWTRKRPHMRKGLYLKRHYGVTLDWYDAQLERQGGVCAICGGAETIKHAMTQAEMHLAVDHDADTGAVRGLLCAGCNTGIGGLKHSIANLRAAVAYLDQHSGVMREGDMSDAGPAQQVDAEDEHRDDGDDLLHAGRQGQVGHDQPVDEAEHHEHD